MKLKEVRANTEFIFGFENGIELHGENGKQAVTMFLDEKTFKAIADIFIITGHLGHAVWHYNGNVPAPCELCKVQPEIIPVGG